MRGIGGIEKKGGATAKTRIRPGNSKIDMEGQWGPVLTMFRRRSWGDRLVCLVLQVLKQIWEHLSIITCGSGKARKKLMPASDLVFDTGTEAKGKINADGSRSQTGQMIMGVGDQRSGVSFNKHKKWEGEGALVIRVLKKKEK